MNPVTPGANDVLMPALAEPVATSTYEVSGGTTPSRLLSQRDVPTFYGSTSWDT